MTSCLPELKQELTAQSTGFKLFGEKIDHGGLGIFARRLKKRSQQDQPNQNAVDSPSFMAVQSLLCL